LKNIFCRSDDKLSSGDGSKKSDTKLLHQARDPLWNPRPNLTRVTRKITYPEEAENREEDNAENRNAEVCLLLEKTGILMVSAYLVF